MEQARQPAIGPKLIDLIRAVFELRGEDVVRRRNGRVVVPCEQVAIQYAKGQQRNVAYYRIKFALARGWLPEDVDHADVNHGNHTLANLRPATHQQNMCNRGPVKRRDTSLPRGVYRKSPTRYVGQVTFNGKSTHLGSFRSSEAASTAVEAKLQELHGEFYRAPL